MATSRSANSKAEKLRAREWRASSAALISAKRKLPPSTRVRRRTLSEGCWSASHGETIPLPSGRACWLGIVAILCLADNTVAQAVPFESWRIMTHPEAVPGINQLLVRGRGPSDGSKGDHDKIFTTWRA